MRASTGADALAVLLGVGALGWLAVSGRMIALAPSAQLLVGGVAGALGGVAMIAALVAAREARRTGDRGPVRWFASWAGLGIGVSALTVLGSWLAWYPLLLLGGLAPALRAPAY